MTVHTPTPPVFHFDTETFLIAPGIQAPPMVCIQFAVDDGPVEVIHARDPAARRMVEWALAWARLDAHNLAFDAAVLAAWAPDLVSEIFRAYDEDRMTDTAIREKLVDIARGRFKGQGVKGREWGYSLAECVQRAAGVELDKTDPWRMKYGTLFGTPVAQWPQDAVAYATMDVVALRTLFRAQEAHRAILDDEFRQARAAFWIRLMECWGFRTDPVQVEKFHAMTMMELARDRKVAEAAGLVRPDGTRNMKAAMVRMVQVMTALGEDFQLTDTGEEIRKGLEETQGRKVTPQEIWATHQEYIKLDEDAVLASGDETLMAFQSFGSSKTTLTRVERLRHGTVLPIQSRFQTLMETGRTSCQMGGVKEGESPAQWGFQLQNTPRKPGLKECFVARPGFTLSAVDMDGIELRGWAQVCIWSVGQSRMADVLNSGLDPHTELGASVGHITKAEAYAIRKGERPQDRMDWFNDGPRQVGKIGNFGYQGGMGPATLRTQARKEYRVNLTLEECRALRAAWKQEWPEAQPYLDWISSLTGDGLATIRQYLSNRVRGLIPYTVTANGFFQALVADAMKDAGFHLARECYDPTVRVNGQRSPLFGSRIVNFVHDEFILEVPEDRAHDAAHRQAEIQRTRASVWMPDVKPTCSPTLMDRWSKKAKAVKVGGQLVPYLVAI